VEVVELDYAEAYHEEHNLSLVWDNWRVWIGIAVLLIIINYSPVFFDVFRSTYLLTPKPHTHKITHESFWGVGNSPPPFFICRL